MRNEISTGQAAELLSKTDPQLSDLVRRRKIDPPPQQFAGRRMWTKNQVQQAAAALDILTAAVQRDIDAAFADTSAEVRS